MLRPRTGHWTAHSLLDYVRVSNTITEAGAGYGPNGSRNENEPELNHPRAAGGILKSQAPKGPGADDRAVDATPRPKQ